MAEKTLHELTPQQKAAVDPAAQVWLHASAGTGKTQVLTARVIRLLLQKNVRPENLMCITFTKAGAAEMSERINAMLARWVQASPESLAADLNALGANIRREGETMRRARSLFAEVLDAPGGGLQIQTIHSLAQSLLGSFPEEAGLVPGFAPVEGREQAELYSEALAAMVEDAEVTGDTALIENLQEVSLALGEESALKFLQKCAGQPDAMDRVPDDAGALIFARRLAGVTFDGPVEAFLETQLGDDVIDRKAIEALAEANLAWSPVKGSGRATAQREWLAMSADKRALNFSKIHRSWTSTKGEIFATGPKNNQSYDELMLQCFHWSSHLNAQIMAARYADRLAPALLAGKAFSAHYAQAKKARGLVDFDDMIRKTAALLHQPGIAEWIRYKLDSRIDHILVDEAQDTNRAQWDIIEALADDFFSGTGAKGETVRTIFAVGDEKQAIFGFQGTDPVEYNAAKDRFASHIADAGQELNKLSLSRSYRSSWPILETVNAVFSDMPDLLGDTDTFDWHESGLAAGQHPEAGTVELLHPVTRDQDLADDSENWVADEKRILAAKLADRVKQMVDTAPLLAASGRKLRAGDIMILLRSRGELASALVAQLHQRGVAVAGIDRLKMQEPLVVQDMLAAVRFALQPQDQYSLACLLVSPLFGWTQEKLLQYGYRPAGIDLWAHLQGQSAVADELQPLRDILQMADFTTAYDFLENLLSGPIAGRRKFAARLGDDARIPMEELLNLALMFEQQSGGTLQAFLRWFDSGETQIKREMLPDSDEVRVMTVHGAKGLQSPLVILADVASDPEKRPDHLVSWKYDGAELPMLNIRSDERYGQLETIVDSQKKCAAEEHMRLLYVAMTRAEEYLIMAGSLSQQSRGKAPLTSWFPHIARAMDQMGCDWEKDDLFGTAQRFHVEPTSPVKAKADARVTTGAALLREDLPDWALSPAPPEASPPRPLVPSRLDDDDYGEAPAAATTNIAAEKGRLIHMLFERMATEDIDQSLETAANWLKGQSLPDGLTATDLLLQVEQIVRNGDHARWFAAGARAEVPLTAVVGDTVISGRADRLIVRHDAVELLDFKTGRNVPDNASGVQPAFLRQMAHYVAALEVIFPGRAVSAAILYTHAPKLIILPAELLLPYRPAANRQGSAA